MRRRRSTNNRAPLFLAWALFAGLAPPPARAAPAPARDVAQLTLPLQLEVFLNGHPTSLIAGFILEPGGRISAKRSELGDVGIKAPGEGGPDMVVALDDAPGLTYRYDEQKQSIHIEAPEELLLGREYHARGAPDNDRPPLRKGFGAVVNYDLFTSTISPINTLRPSYQGASATLDTRLFFALRNADAVRHCRLDARQTHEFASPQHDLQLFRSGFAAHLQRGRHDLLWPRLDPAHSNGRRAGSTQFRSASRSHHSSVAGHFRIGGGALDAQRLRQQCEDLFAGGGAWLLSRHRLAAHRRRHGPCRHARIRRAA